MSDIVEKLRAEISRKQDAEGDRLYLASPCPVLTEAAEAILALRKAYEAAVAFIDSHVADPDITGEMVQAYAEYQRTRDALSTTEAK